jgi:uncharacterized protein
MGSEFFIFSLVGFLAQLVDGALGMAYGVVSSSALLAFGVSPAAASASTHAAELFTTAASSGSHLWHRNVNWRLFWQLAPAGIIGGIFGTYVLTSFDGAVLRPFVAAYLGAMGAYILWRALFRPLVLRDHSTAVIAPLGVAGGFMDAVGGGGWGPVVTTGIVGTGGTPRETIGTVNTAEFFLTVAVSVAFLTALLTGHWSEEKALTDHLWAVLGLILGGLLAAPLAGHVVKIIPARRLLLMVGTLIIVLAIYQTWRLF